MAKLMMGCGENRQIVLFCLFCFFLCTLFFLCTQKNKKNKHTYFFFLCTQILGLTISHCARKHCLWHALDS
jgi:hypothetical protein